MAMAGNVKQLSLKERLPAISLRVHDGVERFS